MNKKINSVDNQNQKLQFNLKTLIILLLFLVGLYFLLPRLIGAEQGFRLILKVNKLYLFLAISSEIISYIGAAWLLGIILSRLGYKISFLDRFRIGSITAFAIHFFPVGTFGEGAVDYYFLRRKNVETGSVLLMLVLRLIFTYIAFLGIFLLGLALVPTTPHLPFSPKIVSFVLFVIIAIGIFYMVYLYRHKEKFRYVWSRFIKFIDFFLSRLRGRKISPQKEEEIFEDIYKGIGIFGKKKRTSVWAVISGLIYWLGDITCFLFVFLSLGYPIHWGILIFGYGVATLAGMISFIPGGLGVTEGSLALIYSGLGVPSTLALMAILIFRLFSFWIWIPIGLVSYLTLRREITKQKNS